MNFRHEDHRHDVTLLDDGTMDTVIQVDGQEFRFSEADRDGQSGVVRCSWFKEQATMLCEEGCLDAESGDDEEEEA